MCGIIAYVGSQELSKDKETSVGAYVGPRDAKSVLLEGLERLEYRGYDSAGVAVMDEDKDKVGLYKSVGRIQNLKEKISQEKITGKVGIGHTRWATHGIPSEVNAHPHTDCNNEFYVVHNGIIENYKELREWLEKKGHKFSSQTDTEVIAHLLEEFREAPLEDAVRKALNLVHGAYALAIISKREPGKLVGAKKSKSAFALPWEKRSIS